jgi:uncharacterized membrane protein
MPSPTAERGDPDTSSRSLALVAVSGLALALWAARTTLAGPRFVFLWWNLFLAWVPWLLSASLRFTRRGLFFWPLVLGWLAFFPNAPYLLTDLIHLKARPPVPMWFDVLLLASFAWAGCLVGWDSLSQVHAQLRTRCSPTLASALIVVAVLLCGVGVFLGRFERLNSWELVTDPLQVAMTASEALLQPRAGVFSLAFASFVGAGYLFTRAPLSGRSA